MKLRKVTTDGEARAAMNTPTPGRERVEFTTKDGAFISVRIGQLHISGGQYGTGMDLMRESPYDPASRYKLVAKVQGFAPAVSYHKTYAERTAAKAAFGESTEFDEADSVDVLVDEHGEVVREVNAEPAAAEHAANAAQIPF